MGPREKPINKSRAKHSKDDGISRKIFKVFFLNMPSDLKESIYLIVQKQKMFLKEQMEFLQLKTVRFEMKMLLDRHNSILNPSEEKKESVNLKI